MLARTHGVLVRGLDHGVDELPISAHPMGKLVDEAEDDRWQLQVPEAIVLVMYVHDMRHFGYWPATSAGRDRHSSHLVSSLIDHASLYQ